MNTIIIEFHSHVDQKNACFSGSDWEGFSEFVPHLFWRLKGRPYVAAVVTQSSFDALVWLNNPKDVVALDELRTGKIILTPTNNSLNSKNDFREV